MSSIGEVDYHYNGMTFLGGIYERLENIIGNDVIDIAYDLGTLLASNLNDYANGFKSSFVEVLENRLIETNISNANNANDIKNTKLDGEQKIRTLTSDINELRNMRIGLNDSRSINEINTRISDKENEIKVIKDEMYNRIIDLTRDRVDRINDIDQNAMLNVLILRVQLASVIIDPVSMSIDYQLNVDNTDNYSLGLRYLTTTIYNMIDRRISRSIATNVGSLIRSKYYYSLRLFTNKILADLSSPDNLRIDNEELQHLLSTNGDRINNYDRLYFFLVENKHGPRRSAIGGMINNLINNNVSDEVMRDIIAAMNSGNMISMLLILDRLPIVPDRTPSIPDITPSNYSDKRIPLILLRYNKLAQRF